MLPLLVRRPRYEKPTLGRFFLVSGPAQALLVLSFSSVALAEPAPASGTLTEGEVVERIMGNSAIDEIVRGAADEARAASAEATRLPNPAIAYSREEVFGGSGGAADDYLVVSQTVPLSGARGLRLRAGEGRAKAAELSGRSARARLASRARFLFYEALLAQHRAEAVESWIDRLSSALAIVAAREQSGDAAAYERARLERELTSARARVALEAASGRRLRGVLAGLLGLDDERFSSAGRIEGSILPRDALPPVDTLLAELDRRPDFLALEERIDAARLDERAAGRGWVPSLTLEGGYRSAEQEGARGHGYLVSVGLSIPIFDHDQAARRLASAKRHVAQGERELLTGQARGEVIGLHGAVGALSETARGLREQSETTRPGIVRAVESAYRGDEASLLELLDVHRSVLDDELQVLELEMSARRARIEIDLALGRIQP